MKPEILETMLNDKETRLNIIGIINLRQEERIIQHRQEIIQNEITILQSEIEVKHKLKMLELPILIRILQDKEYSKFYEEILNEAKKQNG